MADCNTEVTYGEPNPATKVCERPYTHLRSDANAHYWMRGLNPIWFYKDDPGVKPHEEPLLSDEDLEVFNRRIRDYACGLAPDRFFDELLKWLDEALKRRRNENGTD